MGRPCDNAVPRFPFALWQPACDNRGLGNSTCNPEAETTMAQTLPRAISFALFLAGFVTNMSMTHNAQAGVDVAEDARAFIHEHEQSIRPKEREAALALWNANVTGRDEDFKAKEEAQNRLDAALA